jgi:glutaconate CoA-transferase subunit A
MAAKRRFMSTERIVPPHDFAALGPKQSLCINRMMTDGVIEAPLGAHFTACEPDYGRDEAFQREYAATAADPATYRAFKERYLDLESHEAYRKAILARACSEAR